MVSRETDHSGKTKYPELQKPVKGQALIDKLNELSAAPLPTSPIDIKPGVEVMDVKAISTDENEDK